MSVFGSVPVFNYKCDEWSVHVAQLRNFFLANGINDTTDAGGSKRRAILLNCMAQDSYRLTRDLLYPVSPETAAYTVIIETLNAHFDPKKCVYAERYKFYSAKKESHESVLEYAARLRGLASECNFGSALEMCLSDRFVLGIDSSAIREKLYREDPTKLTLAKAQEVACAVESAQKVACVADFQMAVKQEPLHYTKARQGSGGAGAGGARPGRGDNGGGEPARCSVCGGKTHGAADCGYRHLNCDICGVKGHLKKVCSSKSAQSDVSHKNPKNKKSKSRNHYLCESDDNCDFSPVNNIRCTDEKPMAVDVCVRDVTLSMEVDSGSGVSALPAAIWHRYFPKAVLGESQKILRTYSGSVLSPVGVCELPVTYNKVTHTINFYIVNDGPVPLLGRDFMSKFNLALVALNFCSVDFNHVLGKYESLFSDKLGTFNKYKLSLHLNENATPKFCKARSVPFAIKDKVSAELDRLVRVGILKPVSYSRYASPIVAVLKKNNDVRICGDYSGTINKVLKVDSYPLPKLNELCTSLHDCRYFSKLDLSSSYNQFLLDEASQEYTCINTHKGLFVYTRLVFGLANAPALFQRAMVQLLHGIEGVECFLDDVLIAAPTPEVHWERVDKVLNRLQDAGLMLQRTKCSFFQDKIEYLGFIIDRHGIHKNPDKIKAIVKAKPPGSTKELKSFLGIINFYRTFIPNAAILLEPLHMLLRKDVKWCWTAEHQKSFDEVKAELSSSRVLAHFDPRQQLVLTVDAAPGGLGAVLAVRYRNGTERPLSYASRALAKSERAYSQIQKEAAAIIYGIKKFHQYLYGRQQPFILRTDHKPLLSIFSPDKGVPQMTEARLQRYALFLAAYNYKIEYVSSLSNVADYLSRFPVDDEPQLADEGSIDTSYINALAAAGAPMPASLDELRTATAADDALSSVLQYMVKGWPKKMRTELLPYSRCRHELHIDNGCLMRGHRVVVPTVFRAAVLQELHAAHLGIVKMKMTARERCWYPGIDSDIEGLAQNCVRCIQMRPAPARAQIEVWKWPNTVFERIHLDYLGPFQGKMFLVVVDARSKWLECVEVANLSTQNLITKLQKIFSQFGLPNTIVSDNAKSFTSSEFTKFCADNGINQLYSPVYSPQSNGLAENAVKTCKKFLTNAIKDGHRSDLNQRLDEYLFHYRNTPHCTTGVSPAYLMFGRNLRCKLDLFNSHTACQQPEEFHRVRLNQERQKEYSGGKYTFYSVNDKVWVRDYRHNPKKPAWVLGRVVSRVGKVLYDVAVSDEVVWRRHANQLMNANSYIANDAAWYYDKFEMTSVADESAPSAVIQPQGPATPEPPARGYAGTDQSDDGEDTFATPPHYSPSLRENSALSLSSPGPYRTRSGRTVLPPKRFF